MTDDYLVPDPAAAPVPPADPPPRHRMLGLKLALVGAGVAAGAIGATALGASAASSSSTAPSSAGSSSSSSSSTAGSAGGSATAPGAPAQGAPDRDGDGPHGGPGGPGGANPMRTDEKSVSSDVAAKLKAAALAKVPGGTVVRVETDSGDAAYEAHMTKSDGTLVTVKFDKNYAVTAVEDGMGK